MCSKVMIFFGILKIQFCRIVKDFKLNPLVLKKKGFGSDTEDPEGLIQCHAYHQKKCYCEEFIQIHDERSRRLQCRG
jgi:hypothetical protein